MSVVPPAHSEPLVQNNETMRYRPLGRTGLMVSALSFGCMRLSENQDLNTSLISRAIDLGVNYFETTRGYCQGQCQHRTAPGLKGKTSGVIISGKAFVGQDTTAHSFRKEIDLQLDILGLTHFKFFQVGWFSWGSMPHLLRKGGALEAIRRAKDEGLIHFVGFTGHDTPENFNKCVETGLFDTLTIPYSLLNRTYEPTIKRAGERGLGVVAMCPVAGGALAYDSSKLRQALKMDLPTSALALRFVLSNPDISTACSGMNTLEQLEENVQTVKRFDPEKDAAFEALCEGVDRLRRKFGDKICTTCGYCMPCPKNINIPWNMEIYRNWKCFGLGEISESQPGSWVKKVLADIPAEQSAKNCNQCGACEEKCPNRISVRNVLKELYEVI
ncbi:MAG: aldo/keto reductase [Phycisphaerae bacterium]